MKKIVWTIFMGVLLSGCVTRDDDSPAAPMIRIAKKARQSGNSEAAISFYNKALNMDANSAEAYLGLAETYIDMKLLDAATEYIKKAEALECNMARVSYLRGKVHLLLGDAQAAEAEFMKNKSIDSMNALGAVFDGRGEHQKAQQLYKQVISRDPNYIDAYNNMGLSLMLCDNYKDAIFYLESACSLPGANVAYRSNLALVYGLAGNIEKAKGIYAQDFEGDELEEKTAYLEDIISSKR